MIHCGTDILEIKRIEKSIQNKLFLSRVYSKNELELFAQRDFNPSTMAVNFCAKEAFVKALGTGFRGIALNEISILRDELGAPYFSLSGNAEKIVAERNLTLSVSLSHSKEYATAVVIAYSI